MNSKNGAAAPRQTQSGQEARDRAIAQWRAQETALPDWQGETDNAEERSWPSGWWLIPATAIGTGLWGLLGWLLFRV